ncbi:hypothetical protein KRX56_02735 [Dermabacteraceae bacterium TAE3-ERU27]|nr:hypothetical protein [Dermabacteraceae bacterium TAE3-ERU27]
MNKVFSSPPSRRALLAAALLPSRPALRGKGADAVADAFLAPVYRIPSLRLSAHAQAEFSRLVRGMPWRGYAHPGYLFSLALPLMQALLVREGSPLNILAMRLAAVRVLHDRPIPLREAAPAGKRARGTEIGIEARLREAAPGRARAVATILYGGGVAATLVCDFVAVDGHGEDARTATAAALRPAGDAVSRWRIPAGAGRTWSRLSGDVAAGQFAAVGAQLAGFDRAYAPGMLLASRALSELATDVSVPYLWSADFSGILALPGNLRVAYTRESDHATAFASRVMSGRLEFIRAGRN